jgi:two-component system response regulator AtoC
MPGMDGVDVLRQIKQSTPAAIVLMMSAYHMVDRAVDAMKLGAYDYLIKPFHLADMIATLHRASEMLALRVRVRDNVEQAKGRYDFGRIVTENPDTRRMLEVARKAAESDHTTVLIQGESGTGKGVLAKAIHYEPSRSHAARRTELRRATRLAARSELFGSRQRFHRRAAARSLLERSRPSLSRRDCSMSASVGPALRSPEAPSCVSAARTIGVDIRLIAATNAHLKEAVSAGHFREDLYYRLNVVPLEIPPLRERRQDILSLALELVQHFNRELHKKFPGFTPAAAELLQQYPWPGNIRELKNVVERTMILAPEGDIDVDALPEEIRDHVRDARQPAPEPSSDYDVSPTGHQFLTLREIEDDYIREVLAATGNNKTQSARILGIHPTSLLRRLKKSQEG